MSNKQAIYEDVTKQILSVLEGETSVIARMATVSCLLHDAFENRIWTGFYMVDEQKENELVVGPYQGTLGCLRIPFARGVCGAAAREDKTQVIEDVHDFPGHIACDSRSVSEIVVPVKDKSGKLIAVLDIDSELPSQFDAEDKEALEALVEQVFTA